MCDYSLRNFKSRPARVGDRLITRDFDARPSRASARLLFQPIDFNDAPTTTYSETRSHQSVCCGALYKLGSGTSNHPARRLSQRH